jgi:hypothetical protein
MIARHAHPTPVFARVLAVGEGISRALYFSIFHSDSLTRAGPISRDASGGTRGVKTGNRCEHGGPHRHRPPYRRFHFQNFFPQAAVGIF